MSPTESATETQRSNQSKSSGDGEDDDAGVVSPAGAENTAREVAKRVFAGEYNAATEMFAESDEERAPQYVLLPTGGKANRVFAVGTLTETQDVGNDSEYWQGRIVDPTGTFFVYAGQYQPDAASVLRAVEPPVYVAVVGKARTYETDDGNVNASIRPESISEVGEVERNRWVVETAERTIERLEAFDPNAEGIGPNGENYAEMAVEAYDPDLDSYRSMVTEALDMIESEEDSDDD